jgi:phosphate transport system substrate-binding protein
MMGPLDRLGGAANAIHSARSPFGRLHRQAGDLQGIAFTVFFYEERMAPTSNVRRIAVDGVMPWAETIRTRRYPLTSEVQLVIRADAPQRVRALRDWLLSAEGQERVVRESGYVPIIDAEAAAPADE